jgi:FkbM family methyltransferase
MSVLNDNLGRCFFLPFYFLYVKINSMNDGIIHIGANGGQESDMYYRQGNRKVVFIEASPFVMPTLLNRISKYKNQIAIQALVIDKDGIECDFLCDKNNAGQSSSLFDFHLHKKMFPKVVMGECIKLIGKTLPTILKENNINLDEYKHINMDVEGAELLVLKGAVDILNNFETIILEVSDFESRNGQPLFKDIEDFMSLHNFIKLNQRKIHHADGINVIEIEEGSYYEVTYIQKKL